VVKTFKTRIRFESVLIRLSGVGACRGIDPLSDFFISARGQTSHWASFFIYVVEQIAHLGHLLTPLFLPVNICPQMWKWHSTSQYVSYT